MNPSSFFENSQSNELTNHGEQPDVLYNAVVGNLFGSPFRENALSPLQEMGTVDQVPSDPLQNKISGSSSVNRNENLLKDPLSNSRQGSGNESQAGSGFMVTSGSFPPQWNGPSEIELTQRVEMAEQANGNLENIFNNTPDSIQQGFTAPLYPRTTVFTGTHIADPRDPLSHVSPSSEASDQATLGQRSGANTSSERNGGYFMPIGNTKNFGGSSSRQKHPVPTNSISNEELLELTKLNPTVLLNESRDLTFGDQRRDDSNLDEGYQPSENGNDMSTDSDEDEELCCPECNLKFGDKDALRRHQNRAHRTSEKQFRCDNCNGLFASRVNVQRHTNNAHTGEQNYACDLCTATFSTSRGLCIHKRKGHSDVPTEQGGPRKMINRPTKKVHTCRLCSYSSNQSYNVKRHFRTVHLKQGYLQCPNRGCGRICMSKSNYNTHIFTCRKRSKK